MAIKLGIVGVGVIARNQHLPVIAASDRFELVAAASRNAKVEGVRTFSTIAEMLAAAPEIEAVALCAPPYPRAAEARLALQNGRHVLLEKPPGATVSEVYELVDIADKGGLSLFASWHSRYAAGVEPARAWLRPRVVRSVNVEWREDVRVWHPGQDWIFSAGGMGVFDPGINALSILTYILPARFALRSGRLDFPRGRQAPIAGDLTFEDTNGATVRMALDFLQTGPQIWTIRVETNSGVIELAEGGAKVFVDGAPLRGDHAPLLRSEYAALYEHFADLIAGKRSDVDLAPLQHVADAFMLAERVEAPAFSF
jgi:D-galactose 1-dehydrogenase